MLKAAFGPGTGTGGGINKPDQAKVNALPRHLLEYYEQVASAQNRKVAKGLQEGTISIEAGINNIHTMSSQLNAVQKALGRLGKVLPVIGGIFVVSNTIAWADDFNTAVKNYATDVRRGEDVGGSAAILSGYCNDLAPGSGNIVLNYLLY